jgi:hypothetical protein
MSKFGGGGGVQNANPDPSQQTTTPGLHPYSYDPKKRSQKVYAKTAATLGKQASIGGPANRLKSGKMAKPLIDTSRFKIKKRSR